jgi:hypothetical protein
LLVCIQNPGYQVSLELWKIYQTIPDAASAAHHLLRVVDESGEDYLYPELYFVSIELPESLQKALLLAR